MSDLHDRPTVDELIVAVREFLERDVMAATEGRVQFHTRVAVNVLGAVSRELTDGPAADATERAFLRDILGHDGDLRALNAELAARIRDGSLDDRRAEILTHL